MKNIKITDYFAKLVLSVLLSFSLIYPLTTTLAIPYNHYEIAGMSLVVHLILSIMFINKKILKFALICILFSVVIALIYLFVKDSLFYVYDPIIWLIGYIKDIQPFDQNYSVVITILFCIGLSTFVFIFTFIKFNFLILVLSGIILFSSQRILIFFVDRAYIAFYVFCISILIYYFLHIYYKKSSQSTYNIVRLPALLIFIFPIAILVISLTNLIPVSSKPIQWKWMDSKVQKIYSNFTFRFGDKSKFNSIQNIGDFSLASIGFGNDTSLGGNIKLDNTKVLEVESDERIYLRGRSKNHYENNNWDLTYKTLLPEDFSIESSYSNKKYSVSAKNLYAMHFEKLSTMAFPHLNDFHDDFSSLLNTSITYHDIETNSIFTPLNPLFFNFDEEINIDLLIFDAEDILFHEQPFKKNNSYLLRSYFFDTTNETFQKTLRQTSNNFYSNRLQEILKEISESILSTTYKELTNFFEENPTLDVSGQNNPGSHVSNTTTDNDNLSNSIYDINVNIFEQIQSKHDDQIENFKSSEDIILQYINIDNMSRLELLIASCFTDLDNGVFQSNKYTSKILTLLREYFFVEFIDYGYGIFFFKEYSISTHNDLYPLFQEYFTYKSLLPYLNFIFDNYTFIPDTIPDRVHQLAYEITQDEQNNFDKVKAIETYLSENYYYTLLPGDIPNGQDFVDYFLFDSQQGYCTYFATAMAILTRCLGIPSRYIEGYRLPPNPIEGNLYEVRNTEAHAWVEVFFEGFGWVTFEPTATYNYAFYNSGSTPPPHLANQMQPGNKPNNYQPSNYQPSNHGNTNRSPLNNKKTSKQFLSMRLILITLLILLIFPMILAFNILRRKIKLHKIYKLNPRECIIKLFEEYLKYLKILSKPVMGGETPLEYAKRIDAYGYFHPHSFSEITNLFVKARYSQLEITEQDKEMVYKFYSHVLDAIPKKLKLRYLFTIT